MADRLRNKVALVVGAGSIGPGWGKELFLWGAFADALKALPPVPTWPPWPASE